MPAIMKGYIDRVMSYGFAYRYDQGTQKGFTSDKGIYPYCGLDLKNHLFFDKADRTTEETIKKWTSEIEKVYL